MNVFSQLSYKEIALGALVVVFLFILSNPFNLYMLSMGEMLTLTLLIVAFLGFATLVWKETHAKDEREVAHQALVGRVAYIAGAATLLMAIVVQTFQHDLDMALVLALGVMVLAKIISSAYVRARF